MADQKTTTPAPRKLVNPENNVFQVSSKANPRSQAFVAKVYLKKFETVELHGLGEATKGCVRVAENLHRQGLVTIEKIESFTHESERGKRVKLIVKLKVTAEGKTKINEQVKE